MTGTETLPTIADIEDAARQIAPQAVRTPLLESDALNDMAGCRILLKAEPLQRTGSFKFRGAYNRISRLDEQGRRAGVVAFSSGNHAQGVAAAASLAGAPAVIVMPDDAPAAKREGTQRWGAEIVAYDRNDHDQRERIADAIIAERGGTLVRPFDDPFIIAGQGTAGLELLAQAAAIEATLDAVLVPCGGGGLTAGIATVFAARSPAAEIFTVEPDGFDDTARSLKAGSRQRIDPGASSFCDALLAPRPGTLTFAINRQHVTGGLAVSDIAVARAMKAAFQHLKLVIEPGGAVALAAVLSGLFPGRGKTVAVVASGGNVDAATFADILGQAGTA